MSRTVGLPAAMGAELLLNGVSKGKGVIAPVKKEVYLPILKQLEQEGIIFKYT